MRWAMLTVYVSVLVLNSGCATMEGGAVIEGSGGVVIGEPPRPPQGKGEHDYGLKGPPGVPPGHIPSPGECRIWYPGSPPGQQPPPGRCEELAGRVPPGAWLIYGGPKGGRYKVEEYDRQRSGLVISVRYYDVDTGTLISIEKR